ncbi:MAG TPA: glycosyltransferase family 2 protein [Ohtaekwangia sp.]
MKTSDQPVISVIVPTYQGAHRILITLSSLANQRFTDFEVIVVIDGSTDNTAAVITKAKLPMPVRVHEQENRGRAGARNAGAALAKSPYLVFFDDDVEIPENVIAEYVQMINVHPVVVGAFYPLYKIKNEFAIYSSYLNDQWTTTLPVRGKMSAPYLSAANFFIERKVFEQEGGFNGALPDTEDFDLAVRLFEKGITLFYNPDLKVGHAIQQSFGEYATRLLQYKNAQRLLLAENPRAAKYITSHIKPKGVKALIYACFSAPLYIRLIDAGFFRILPQKLRFRLYNLILVAYPLHHSK